MKKYAGTLRLDLASYREMAAFSQFASDLDKATRQQLERGQRMTEILKQGQYVPLGVEKQVMMIFAGVKGYLDKYPVSELSRYERELYGFIDDKHPDVLKLVTETRKFSDKEVVAAFEAKLNEVLKAFDGVFVVETKQQSA